MTKYYEEFKERVRFPEHMDHFRYHAYPATQVDDWFKRCMKDFPTRDEVEPDAIYDYGTLCEGWFEAWFSQFREES